MKKMAVLFYSMIFVFLGNLYPMQGDNENSENTFWQRVKSVGTTIANVHPTVLIAKKVHAAYQLGKVVSELPSITEKKVNNNNTSLFSWFYKKEKPEFHRAVNRQVILDVELRHAINEGKSLEIIKGLLEAKANPNSDGCINRCLVPLIFCVIATYKDQETLKNIVETFMQHGADIYKCDDTNNNTVLHVAATEGVETFKTLCLLTTDKPSDYEKQIAATFLLINKKLGAFKLPKFLCSEILNKYAKIPLPHKPISIATPYLLSIKTNNNYTALDVLFQMHGYKVDNNECIKSSDK